MKSTKSEHTCSVTQHPLSSNKVITSQKAAPEGMMEKRLRLVWKERGGGQEE